MGVWGGMLFWFGSLFGPGYFDAPGWVSLAIAAGVLLGGIGLTVAEMWDEPGAFCGTAITLYAFLYGYGFLSAAEGEGGWEPLSGGNGTLVLYMAVLGLVWKFSNS